MARNKYPEETVKRILDVSMNLFLTKGYDHTTIQDIINELGNLSKGAIYHHFKSKEEIFEAGIESLYEKTTQEVMQLVDQKGYTGLEKLKKILMLTLKNPNQKILLLAAPNIMRNPKILTRQLVDSVEVVSKQVIQPVIEEGMKDGSIMVKKPNQAAQVLAILANIWINPSVFLISKEELDEKYIFLKELSSMMGVPVFDEEIQAIMQEYRTMLEDAKKNM